MTIGVIDKYKLNQDPNLEYEEVFKINDIELIIPPSSITVHKEDLYWQYKTLRTKTSTKVASGHGLCVVQIRVVFTPDLLLVLHRLIVEFRNSPFCVIKSNYLQDSIKPIITIEQLAFSMIGMNVSMIPDMPGSFLCEIDFRLFNYKPFGSFLYRKDFVSVPIIRGKKRIYKTIDFFYPEGSKIVEIETDLKKHSAPSTPSLPKVSELLGGIPNNYFDLNPELNNIMKSPPVPDPSRSKIFVRYINSLQAKALWENFALDIIKTIKEEGENPDYYIKGDPINSLSGIIRGFHTHLPEVIREKIIFEMFKRDDSVAFLYDEYLTLQIRDRKALEEARKIFLGSAANLGFPEDVGKRIVADPSSVPPFPVPPFPPGGQVKPSVPPSINPLSPLKEPELEGPPEPPAMVSNKPTPLKKV